MANTPKEIIKVAKQMIKDEWVYVYGYKGNTVTKSGVMTLASQYPKVYSSSIKSMALKKVGKIGIDCSGFVCKAAGISMLGSSQIHEKAKHKWPISNPSHIKNGDYVWRQGHIGLVEIDSDGQKWILEAKGTAYDLKRTKWESRASHFTHYGEIPGVTYEDNPVHKPQQAAVNPYTEPTTLVTSKAHAKKKNIKNYISSGIGVKWVQWELKQAGYNDPNGNTLIIDGECGSKTLYAIKAFQKDHALTSDGLVGSATRKKLKNV